MRSVLETQAAMLAAMTQMQQALLSGMIMRKPEEIGAEPEKGELEGVANQTDQQASKPQTRSKPEHPPTRASQHRTVQKTTSSPPERQARRGTSQPSWFEKRGESHHLSEHRVSHLRGLFDRGLSQSEAARQMGLTPAAVRRRFQEWRAKTAA